MPTYEYACKACGEHLEVVQSFSDPALTTCPACEGPLRKVFGNIGISFKGSGFYKTDSRAANGHSGSARRSEKDAGSSSSGGADTGASTPAESSGSGAKSAAGSGSDSGKADVKRSSEAASAPKRPAAGTATPAAAAP